MRKINGKVILIIVWLLVIGLLVYSRFVNLGWGLPYPMHPDERNMANAIQQLNCKFPISNNNFRNCLNPHFFAYGQFPLYLGYGLIWLIKFFNGNIKTLINFEEAILGLRIISAIAAIINIFILSKIVDLITNKKNNRLLTILIIIFVPFFIQFSHFGTTESLLMLFYSATIYYSLLYVDKKINTLSFVVKSSFLIGLSLATKVSSAIFLAIPFSVLLFSPEVLKEKTALLISKNAYFLYGYRIMNKVIDLIILLFLSLSIFFIFSPHNFINFQDFIGSMRYESDVALGKVLVFYTRQFINTFPIMFQLTKVFPYALGWPVFILGVMGFMGGVGWKDRKINLLRFAFLIYFIPSAIIYAKWTRFMAPIFPIILVLAILFLQNIIHRLNKKLWILAFAGMSLLLTIPGIAYLNIYQKPDIRFQASEWIYKNIPNNTYILSETANVVDIPMSNGTMKQLNNYNVISFNFYDLDENPQLQEELKEHLKQADYIFIPSRRIFANHSKQKYPLLNNYYVELFSGKLGFEKVAEFNSYPEIKLFGKTLITFPDEEAEETWTVFDHPVIRIYKRVK